MKCDCCGSETINELKSYCNYSHFRCNECGFENFVQNNLVISSDVYENDADYLDDLNVLTSPDDLILWHHVKAINYLQSKFIGRNAKTLDVGCFNGFFVKKLLSLGYDAQGVDFNKFAVSYGREQFELGHRISTDTLDELFEKGIRFDAISAFEVLEHLPDPKSFLASVNRLLEAGGVLILSTPNNKMYWRPALDYPPHHLSRFTTKSLDGCLTQLGLNTVYSEEQMSIYELVRHFTGSFFRANDSKSLRGGEFKRKKLTTILRRGMNMMRKPLGVMLLPFDKLLYTMGIRYISQIVVAEKRVTSR